MSEHNLHAHDHRQGHANHGGMGKYILVAIALALLSTGSFLTTSDWWHAHFQPSTGWAFMMAISCGKAMLVILFFMHILWEANWKYVLTIPAAMMSIFLCLMLVPDVGWRTHSYSEERWTFAAFPAGHHAAGGDAKAAAEHAPAKH